MAGSNDTVVDTPRGHEERSTPTATPDGVYAHTAPDILPPPLTDEPPDLRVRFIGRADNLSQLKELFLGSRDRHRLTFVTLLGEPGVGKTRLALEFARSVRAAIPESRVLSGESGSSLSGREPIVRLLAQRFGIGDNEHPEDARQKIEVGVGEVMPARLRAEVGQLLAQLVGYPFPDGNLVEPLTQVPGQLEMRTYIAVRRFFERDAERGPLLLYFDRMERAGRETTNLIHYLADGLANQPVMILASARPTIYRRHRQWGEGDFEHHRIQVGPLPREEAEQLFGELAHVPQPPELLTQVARDRLQGSPRAIYEFTRYLLETKVLMPREGTWQFDDDRVQSVQLPRTHEEILRERLRNLPRRERRALERAAVVGEIFWLDAVVALERADALADCGPDGPPLQTIAALGDQSRTEVAQALANLAGRGLIIPSSVSAIAGEKECRFAYPPIWDLAYELVDEGTKRHYHRLAAQWLELRPEGREPGQQAQVGRHLQRAGDVRGAAYRFRRAADGARAAYANHKAIRLYKRALSCMGDADLAARIHVWHDIGSVYQLKGELDEALDAFERMVRLSWIVASRPKAAVAYNKMGRVWRQKGSFELALKYLERGLAMFGEVNDQRGIATSLDDIGQVFWLTGRYEEALDRSATALEMRRQAADLRSVAVSLSNIGNIEKHRGLFDEAESCYREALALRRKVGDRYGYVVSLNNLGALAFERGKLEEARNQWEESLIEAERIGAVPLQVILLSNLGETAARLNRSSEARQRLQRAMNLAREIEDQRTFTEVLRNLALLELQEGNREAAQRHASDCLARAEQARLPEMVGKAHIALGEVQAATLFDASSPLTPDKQAADRHFCKAIEVFRELGNEAELARALRRLGEYRVEHGMGETAGPILKEAEQIFSRLGMPEASAVRDVIAAL